MSEDLTKLTVNLTKRSVIAMEDAAGRSGDTRTDTVNRALQVYQMVMWLTREPGKYMAVDGLVQNGPTYRITVTRLRWWHRLFAHEVTQ